MTTTVTYAPTWQEWTGLVLLAVPLFMMATDMSIMFLVMPSLAADLGPSTTQTLWIVHVGEFIAAGLVITMGWLTGRVGPRRLLLVAMFLYGLASALAAYSPNPETLLTARVLIGAATAAASPAGIALLRSMFPSAKHFGIALAVVMGTFSAGGALGPPMGGFLLEYFWWGSVFLINVPAAALVLLVGLWLFPRTHQSTTQRLDMTSVVLSITAVILVVMALQEIADQGISVVYTLVAIVGVGLGVWFLRRQRRVANPLLDLNLFTVRALRIAAMVFVLASLAFFAVDFILIQYLQIVAGVSTGRLGLLLAIPGATALIGTAITPVLVRRFAVSHVIAAGLVVSLAGSLTIMVSIPSVPHLVWHQITGTTLIAFGVAPLGLLCAQLIVTSAPERSSGSAVAVQDIAAGLGTAVGMALTGSIGMAVFSRMLRAQAPAGATEGQLDAATQNPSSAVVVAEDLDGPTGQQLLTTVMDAWSWGTVAAYVAVAILGVVTVVLVIRGLRGVQMPDDQESSTIEADEFSADADHPIDAEPEQSEGNRGPEIAGEGR